MKSFVVAVLFQVLFFHSVCNANAGVAEASIGKNHYQAEAADYSNLNSDEYEWFSKFLYGTFYSDGWYSITNDLLVKIPQNELETQRAELKRLGDKIGREWARNNEIRKIDTSMLKQWGNKLKEAAGDQPEQLPALIADLHREVDELLD